MSILKKLSIASVGAALVAVGMLSAGEAQATTISGSGYTATDEIPYTFEDIADAEVYDSALVGRNNAATSLLNIGFNFNFYGTDYSQLSFSSNGLITFTSTSGNNSPTNVNLQTTAPTPNLPSIAPLWDDWTTVAPVFYSTQGTQGNQRFIIQWASVKESANGGSSDPVSFEAVLFEGSNDILLSYQDTNENLIGTAAQAGGALATVGIRNTDGQNLMWSYNSPSILDQYSIRYSQTQAVPFEFSPGLSILALGALFGAERLKNKLQKRKLSQSEFISD